MSRIFSFEELSVLGKISDDGVLAITESVKLEKKLDELHSEINKEANLSDYVLLTDLQQQIDETEELLLCVMEELEELLKVEQ